MELLARAIIGIVVIVLILLLLFYSLQNTLFQHVSKQQAEALVLSDLQRNYPGAIVNITNDTPSNYSGSWHVSASLVLNATSPCPSFFEYSFDYPKFGFQYTVDNRYTQNCVIYGLTSDKPFIISSYPVAITRAYLLNVSSVMNYINVTRFGNVVARAHFYNYTNLLGTNYTNVWLVSFSSRIENHSVYVILSQLNGNLIAAYNMSS